MVLDAAAQAERADQLRLLSDSVAAFAAGRLPLSRARALRAAQPEFEPPMMAELAGQGWLGMLLPEEAGGFDLGFAEVRAVVEGVAAQLAPEPLVPVAVLAAGLLRRCAASERRSALLQGIAEGSAIPAVAWQDCGGGIDLAVAPFTAVAAGADWSLSGEARFVRPGSGATHWLLVGRSTEGLALFELAAGAPGLAVTAEAQADGTALARLRANGLRVPAAARLPIDAEALAAAVDEAVLMNAAELLALTRRMRAMTLDYLKTRVQFGKPIGSFQALQHRAVDLLLQEELTSAAIGRAVAGFDGGADPHQRASLASRAKARAAEAATWTAREAVQLHGGIGVTDEYDLGLCVNRVLSLVPWLGNASAHRRRYALLNPPSAVTES